MYNVSFSQFVHSIFRDKLFVIFILTRKHKKQITIA